MPVANLHTWLEEDFANLTTVVHRTTDHIRLVMYQTDGTIAGMLRPEIVAATCLGHPPTGVPMERKEVLRALASALMDLADGEFVEKHAP